MNVVSEAFRAVMANLASVSLTLQQRIEVWDHQEQNMLASTVPGQAPTYIPLAAIRGSVSAQLESDVVRSLSITLADPDETLTPGRGSRILDPRSRNVVVPYSGYSWDGGEEVWPLGRFFVDTSDPKRGGLAITGRDTSTIAETPVEALFRIEAGWTHSQAVQELITYVEGLAGRAAMMAITPTTETLPSTTVMVPADNYSVLRKIIELAESVGHEAFKDAYGRWTMRPYRQPSTTSGHDLELKANGQTILLESEPSQRISISEISNGVIVKVNAPWLLTPVQGEAWDENPGSPTWIGGPMRKRPVVMENNSVTSLDAANTMAASMLPRYLGSSEEIPFTAIPLPALEPGDLIYYENDSVAVSGVASLKAFEIPLGTTDPMTGTLLYRRTSW